MQPAVFLDRDNTLIAGAPDHRSAKVNLLEGVGAGLKRLHDAGFQLVVVTNQAGVARGMLSEDDVVAVHQCIAALVHEHAGGGALIERFYYCPYDPAGTMDEYRRDHSWRKPQPGMILQAACDLNVDLSQSWMIGDDEHDIAAGRAAGCRTILVSRDAQVIRSVQPSYHAGDFEDAVNIIVQHQQPYPAAHHASSNGDPARASVTPPVPQPNALTSRSASSVDELVQVRRSITDLIEEVRTERMRKADFSLVRLLAWGLQLLALLLAMLGLMHLNQTDAFVKWMLGAAMAQLLTITLLLVDSRT